MQPVWDEYVTATRAGSVPFNTVDYTAPPEPQHAANALLDRIDTIPVVLAIAADLRRIVATDAELDRAAIVPGASIYPFCWNLLLAARQRGLGGVMTTFLSRAEPAAAPLLELPPHHALAAVVFLGHPVHQPTKLSRRDGGGVRVNRRFRGSAPRRLSRRSRTSSSAAGVLLASASSLATPSLVWNRIAVHDQRRSPAQSVIIREIMTTPRMIAAAAAASIHQWLPVAMIDSTIKVGCRITNQRHCVSSTVITAMAAISAQPKWSDGIAAIWLAAPSRMFFG